MKLIVLDNIKDAVATGLSMGFERMVEDIAHDTVINGVSSFRVAALVNDGLREFIEQARNLSLTKYIEVHRNVPVDQQTDIPFGTQVRLTDKFAFYNVDEDVENPPEVGDVCLVVGNEKGDEGGIVYLLVDQRCPRYTWLSDAEGFEVVYRGRSR